MTDNFENNLETDITDVTVLQEDEALDFSLRPKRLRDYVGQESIKENIVIFTSAAKKRGEPVEHILLYGPPGLGKTTLAHILANEMEVNIKITSGPAIQRSGDLVALLTNLETGDVIFIDEIHRLQRNVEEILYAAMEDYAIDLVLGKGPSAKSMRMNLPKFTLVGATTKFGSLSSPLRDRFGAVHRLEFYSEDELAEIVRRSAQLLNIKIDQAATVEIAKRSRRTPRIANRILKRVRDWAEVKYSGKIDLRVAKEAIAKLDIDDLGLDKNDRDYLHAMIDKFNGGPVGLETLAATLSEDKDTIEDVIEPYMLQLGFINRTNRGRIVTSAACDHLNVAQKKEQAELL